MLDREPFLKAIFANPADDLPRLVFADYLEEHGDGDWAELMRLECDLASRSRVDADQWTVESQKRELAKYERAAYLHKKFHPDLYFSAIDSGWGDEKMLTHPFEYHWHGRGFYPDFSIRLRIDQLSQPDDFRIAACSQHPEWYGSTQLKITGGRLSPEQLLATLSSPVTEHVTELDLSGEVIETPAILNDIETNQGIPVFDMETRPVVNLAVVEALAQSREARRLVTLNLENNDLDNDAARALIRSPNLLRLKRLSLFKGNRFRATVWQQLTEKYDGVLDPSSDEAGA